MSRKVFFPLKLKIIGTISLLLLSSLTLYVWFALDLFQKDKSAYVYDVNLNSVEGLSREVKGTLNRFFKDARNVAQLYWGDQNQKILKRFIDEHEDLVSVALYEKKSAGEETQFVTSFFNPKLLEDYNIEQGILETANRSFDEFPIKPLVGHYEGFKDKLLLVDFSVDEKYFVKASFLIQAFIKPFDRKSLHEFYVLDEKGSIFIHNDSQRKMALENMGSDFYKEIVTGPIQSAVKEFVDGDGRPLLVAFQKLSPFNYFIVGQVPKDVAFKAAEYLVNKSVYFGLLIVSISVFVGIFFARTLTSPLEALFGGTLKLAGGDFSNRVKVESRDEIGSLTDSFNLMSDKIVHYMDEMKEKTRMENEMAVAKLVQTAFFPTGKEQIKDAEMAGYFRPASECGGDWWGYKKLGDKTVVILADATGHGVPAALLTATAHSCLSSLEKFYEQGLHDNITADKVLEHMNHAVCQIGSSIMMTCFCLIIHHNEKKLTYSNASHNQPFLFKNTGKEVSKGDFKPLMEANGPRLGHKAGAQYECAEISYETGDSAFLYTDGIIECKNPEEKEWGNRRFLKALMAEAKSSPDQVINHLLTESTAFQEGVEPDDDITFVGIRFTEEVESKPMSIGFLGKDKNNFELLKECVSGHNEVWQISPFGEEKGELDFIVAFYSELDESTRDQVLTQFGPKLFLISDQPDEYNIENILVPYKINHLIGANAANWAQEVVNNIEKESSRDFFGTQKYLRIGTTVEESSLSSSAERDGAIDEMLGKFDLSKYFDSPLNYLKTVGNELITNALYDAAVDENGIHRFKEHDRTVPVSLNEGEAITFSMGMDEKSITMSVEDCFGTLSREIFLNNVLRSYQTKEALQKDGGAGLGLYLVASYSNQVIVNISPNQKTEVVAIIDSNKRFKKYQTRITSFHFFTGADS